MMNKVINIYKLSKNYKIGSSRPRYDSLRDAVTASLRNFTFRNISKKRSDAQVWALRDVTFEISRGEIVGIIGRNGAGKSTLLKILSRITKPTNGWVRINGSIGSLLEVGTGFHPELTGRENIFLNGAILGMKKREINKKFDEIVAFAEIDRFLDTPVKRYSSGMFVRLAFAVAAHLEPDILLVDEVLAVGDSFFQKKCLGKMGDVSKKGRTVLFVSHNMGAIRNLCQRVIVLDSGELTYDGPVENGVRKYLSNTVNDVGLSPWVHRKAESEWVNLESVFLSYTSNDIGPNNHVDQFFWSDSFYVKINFQINKLPEKLRISVYVTNGDGIRVFATKHILEKCRPGKYQAMINVPGRMLNAGMYNLDVHFDRPWVESLIRIEPAVNFYILNERISGESIVEQQEGIIKPDLEWVVTKDKITVL